MNCVAGILAYGLTGALFGQVLGWTGLDALAEKLEKIPRVHVATFVHDDDERMVAYAKKWALKCHLVLIGQSAGANGVVRVAHRLLPEAIPIALLVAFDPPDRAVMPLPPLPANVEIGVFYRQEGLLGGGRIKRERGNRLTAYLSSTTVNYGHIEMPRHFIPQVVRDVRGLLER